MASWCWAGRISSSLVRPKLLTATETSVQRQLRDVTDRLQKPYGKTLPTGGASLSYISQRPTAKPFLMFHSQKRLISWLKQQSKCDRLCSISPDFSVQSLPHYISVLSTDTIWNNFYCFLSAVFFNYVNGLKLDWGKVAINEQKLLSCPSSVSVSYRTEELKAAHARVCSCTCMLSTLRFHLRIQFIFRLLRNPSLAFLMCCSAFVSSQKPSDHQAPVFHERRF